MVELRYDLGRIELSNGVTYRANYEWLRSWWTGRLPHAFQVFDGDEVILDASRRDRGAWRRFWGPNILEVAHRGAALCSVKLWSLGVRLWLDYGKRLIPLPVWGGRVPGLPISVEFGGEPTRCEVDDERIVMLAVTIECVRNWGDFLAPASA